MQWIYKGKTIDNIPDEYEGFVYLITNTVTSQKYIGKKLAKLLSHRSKAEKIKDEVTKKAIGEHTTVVQID